MMGKYNELPLNELPLKQFTFDRDKGTLVAEASEVGFHRVERLYNDACDVGIAIRSELTGKVERFYLTRTDVNDANEEAYEVVGWRFAPVNELCRVRSVLIIND